MYHDQADEKVEIEAEGQEGGVFENTLTCSDSAPDAQQDARQGPQGGEAPTPQVEPPTGLGGPLVPPRGALYRDAADVSPALRAAAEALAGASTSPATRACWASDWRKYSIFCEKERLDPFGSPDVVAFFVTSLVLDGARAATIERALSTVGKAWTLRGLPNPRRDPAVQAVRSGARRTLGVEQDGVDAVSPKALRAMVDALPQGLHDNLRSARNRAALTIGWAGGFRASELLALQVEDVSLVDEGLRIKIRRSKTDQEGRGRLVGIPYSASLVVCPVRAFTAWLQAAQITEGPLFRSLSQDGRTVLNRGLSQRAWYNTVTTLAARAGVEGRFGTHSLRAGLVTAAVEARKNPRAIMQQTGHKSVAMVMRYAREKAIFEDNAAEGLL